MRSSMHSFHERLKTLDDALPDLGLRASLLTLRPRLSINRLSRHESLNETVESQDASSPSNVGSLVRSDSIFMLHENADVSISEGINYSDKKHLKQSFVLGAQEQKATVPLIWKSWTSPDLKHTRNDHPQRSRHSVHSADGLVPEANRGLLDKSAEEKQLAHHADKIRPESPAIDANTEQNPTQPSDSTKDVPISEDEFDLSTELSESESETVEEAHHPHRFPPRVSSLAYSKQHDSAVRALQTGAEVPPATTPSNHPLPGPDFEPSKEAVPHETRTDQATSKADTPKQEGSESQISSRDTSTVTGTQPYSTQSKQLSKQIERMLSFMTNGHAQERSTGKRTVERTRLLDTHVASRDTQASSLPSAHEGKMINERDDCQKLKGKRSFWRLGCVTSPANQADRTKSEAMHGYKPVERSGSSDRDVYDILNTINTIRCDRKVKPLEYCERLCAEAQEIATAHDLQSESAALYGATPDLSSGSALWFDDEASTAALVGPTGFDGLTTADIWMQGKEPRHDQRNHRKVVDDAIQLEHCACYNHKMYVALVDELWSRAGMARTETDERWVVVLGEQTVEEDLLPRNVSSKKTVIKRKPLPQNPYAAEYGIMSPYEWDPDEDAERDTVAGSSRPE
ncbi:hypothetical protein HII31_00826 [Pseudocercospora fuligena]|uniref:Uncharacterized protein n=1 Tax=Pseudocercospora fuligena TaxID=685502 RepID=A0A8H6RVM7_9PEZI|nr:hypothetical protein HII31_00826 [Pseudocercospora fuligena]